MGNTNLHAEVVSAFIQKGANVEDLPDGDPKKVLGRNVGDTFTQGVGFLKTSFPNDAIRQLMALFWDLVGNKITPVALGPNVATLSLAVFAEADNIPRAIILPPHHWLDLVKQDPCLQMGALVFVASQARDFYNQRCIGQYEATIKRARGYEAEFLHTIARHSPIVFSEYQRKTMEEYPNGLLTMSLKDLLYKSKPFTLS